MRHFARLFIICLSFSFGSSSSFNEDLYEDPGRIVGGRPADIKEVPFQLAMYWDVGYRKTHACGASVISKWWAVSAAHCVYGKQPRMVYIRSGSSNVNGGGKFHAVKKIIVHPSYNHKMIDYDISVVMVSDPFHFSQTVQPIRLARNTPPAGTTAVVSGWGRLGQKDGAPTRLQLVQVAIINHRQCSEQHRKFLPVTSRMLCAGIPKLGKGTCYGDSGGPLVAKGVLVGAVSWGRVCGYTPGVFTDIAHFRKWITRQTGVN